MLRACLVVLGLLVAHPAAADTGFLDRSVTLGGRTYRYQVYVPLGYSPARSWPVIVDLHGNTFQGDDALTPTRFALAEAIRTRRDAYPAICVFPQAPKGQYWEQLPMQELVMAQLNATEKEFRVDTSREYLIGFSMGAVGAYRIAYRWPTRFAALAAIAGQVQAVSVLERQAIDSATNPFTIAPDPFSALAAAVKHLPISIYHGEADAVVQVEQSRKLVAALKATGASVRYTEFPAADHLGGAAKAYSDPGLTAWLFAQRRSSKPSD